MTYENYSWVNGDSLAMRVADVFYQGFADHSSYRQHCVEMFLGDFDDDYCYEQWNYLCEVLEENCFEEVCPLGTYLDIPAVGSASCTSCPVGKYQDASDALSCKPCSLGTYNAGVRQTACEPCALGKYSNEVGLAACKPCQDVESQLSTTLLSSSTSMTDCVCSEGNFGRPFQGETCRTCDDEIYSCPTNSSSPTLKSGFFLERSSGQIYKCNPSASCAMTDALNVTQCGEGYTGFACGTCVALQYYRSDGNCVKCANSSALKWFFFIFGFAFVAVLIYRLSSWKGTLPLDLRIMFMSVQIIATYPNIASDWPSKISTFLRITSIGNVDLDLISPDCSFSTSYWTSFNLKMLSPVLIIAAASVFFFGAHFLKLKTGYTVKQSSTHIGSDGMPPLQASVKERQVTAATVGSLTKRMTNWFALVFTFLYTYVVVTLTQPLNCIQQPSGKFTMYSNPGIICFEGEWRKNIVAVVIYAIAYVLVLPLSLSFFFWRNRKSPDHVKEFVNTLVSPYRPEYFWWELATMLRKVVLALTVQVFSLFMSQRTKVYCVLLVLAITMMVENAVQPFPTFQNNYTNFLWQMASILLLLSNGLVFSDSGVSSKEKDVLSGLIIFAFVVLCVLALGTVLKDIILLKFGKSHVKVKGKILATSISANPDGDDGATTVIPMASTARTANNSQ
eukprot:TRINITY_DN16172_c0_g1_i1.p1 TRINITY_DN16172_c0_g1~~TRINITY_DN16172_c0_g1_i1.p1  ORF type:complete len:708 (-),score=170.03 TRINITY_DN16172_c0_g1_i1:26-2053(-)